jgi:hypothetical protein
VELPKVKVIASMLMKGGYKYLKMTSQAVKKATTNEKEMWDEVFQLTESYEANSDIAKVVEPEEE